VLIVQALSGVGLLVQEIRYRDPLHSDIAIAVAFLLIVIITLLSEEMLLIFRKLGGLLWLMYFRGQLLRFLIFAASQATGYGVRHESRCREARGETTRHHAWFAGIRCVVLW
jgi:hypothetical protein